jgi:hypothetical protein
MSREEYGVCVFSGNEILSLFSDDVGHVEKDSVFKRKNAVPTGKYRPVRRDVAHDIELEGDGDTVAAAITHCFTAV